MPSVETGRPQGVHFYYTEFRRKLQFSNPLPHSFYARKATLVARELLGKTLIHKIGREILAGRIVETEAYLGKEDPCSHAYRGPTPRASIMYGPPGRAYVYFVYGNHFCFNVVTHDGHAGAVLVRALEPIAGIQEMKRRRGTTILHALTNGPGKLTQALGIKREQNGADLSKGKLLILDASVHCEKIVRAPRVGISKATAKPWRFALKENPFVSLPHPW